MGILLDWFGLIFTKPFWKLKANRKYPDTFKVVRMFAFFSLKHKEALFFGQIITYVCLLALVCSASKLMSKNHLFKKYLLIARVKQSI